MRQFPTLNTICRRGGRGVTSSADAIRSGFPAVIRLLLGRGSVPRSAGNGGHTEVWGGPDSVGALGCPPEPNPPDGGPPKDGGGFGPGGERDRFAVRRLRPRTSPEPAQPSWTATGRRL